MAPRLRTVSEELTAFLQGAYSLANNSAWFGTRPLVRSQDRRSDAPDFHLTEMKLISQIVLVVAAVAAVAGAVLVIVKLPPKQDGFDIALPSATPSPESKPRVYISGAVRFPGVYSVHDGDRLAQVVEAAGGAVPDADLDVVNLAARVKDEDHWHIPRLGDSIQARVTQGSGTSTKIDVNSADAELLKSLPGIGDVKAQSIVDYRETNGPFSSVEGLLDIHGIGPATLDAIRDLVEVR